MQARLAQPSADPVACLTLFAYRPVDVRVSDGRLATSPWTPLRTTQVGALRFAPLVCSRASLPLRRHGERSQVMHNTSCLETPKKTNVANRAGIGRALLCAVFGSSKPTLRSEFYVAAGPESSVRVVTSKTAVTCCTTSAPFESSRHNVISDDCDHPEMLGSSQHVAIVEDDGKRGSDEGLSGLPCGPGSVDYWELQEKLDAACRLKLEPVTLEHNGQLAQESYIAQALQNAVPRRLLPGVLVPKKVTFLDSCLEDSDTDTISTSAVGMVESGGDSSAEDEHDDCDTKVCDAAPEVSLPTRSHRRMNSATAWRPPMPVSTNTVDDIEPVRQYSHSRRRSMASWAPRNAALQLAAEVMAESEEVLTN